MNKRLPFTTQKIKEEAEKRGIKFKLPFPENNLYYADLEYKGHKELIRGMFSNGCPGVNFLLLKNKHLTNQYLKKHGFNVPEELLTDDIDIAYEFLNKHKRVVVKPLELTKGKGITTNITKIEELKKAFEYAYTFLEDKKEKLLVQEQIKGDDYRILVINFENFYIQKRIPANIIGDGEGTIIKLIKEYNSRLEHKEYGIKTDMNVQEYLRDQKKDFNSVLEKGKKVFLSKVANLHAGGQSYNYTNQACDRTKEMASEIAQLLNYPVFAIDVMSEDLSKDSGKITEINSIPGIMGHCNPTSGEPEKPQGAFIDMLFPETIDLDANN